MCSISSRHHICPNPITSSPAPFPPTSPLTIPAPVCLIACPLLQPNTLPPVTYIMLHFWLIALSIMHAWQQPLHGDIFPHPQFGNLERRQPSAAVPAAAGYPEHCQRRTASPHWNMDKEYKTCQEYKTSLTWEKQVKEEGSPCNPHSSHSHPPSA